MMLTLFIIGLWSEIIVMYSTYFTHSLNGNLRWCKNNRLKKTWTDNKGMLINVMRGSWEGKQDSTGKNDNKVLEPF